MRELHALAESAGAAVCDVFLPIRSKPVASTFVGKGKAQELAERVCHLAVDLVIFDHEISPIQERNLEQVICCRVLDRTGLILDIFAQRATSREGKLQVELAQLEHLSTRLVRGWTHLERQKGGIGLRGPGETQLETDRRLIGKRIRTLSQRLQKVESQRRLQRRARLRTPVPTLSLVGYTNSGKSSLFNAITGAEVPVEDRLFATLDPTMRQVIVPGFGPIVLSDTVGFVRDLPHSLVAAFRSTLEEVVSASCLLLVNDVSDHEEMELREQVVSVLEEIGAGAVPVIHVNNKIDLIKEPARIRRNAENWVDKIWVSAATGEGLPLLISAIGDFLSRGQQVYRLNLRPQAGGLRSRLYHRCDVLDEKVDEEGAYTMTVKMKPADRGWMESQSRYIGLWNDIPVTESN